MLHESAKSWAGSFPTMHVCRAAPQISRTGVASLRRAPSLKLARACTRTSVVRAGILDAMGAILARPKSDVKNFHELSALDIDKKPVDFSTLEGKVGGQPGDGRRAARRLTAETLPLMPLLFQHLLCVSHCWHAGSAGRQRRHQLRVDSHKLQGGLIILHPLAASQPASCPVCCTPAFSPPHHVFPHPT
jgi:hypothetical protein